MLLSICMMVKDEEANLERCLKSIQNILKAIDSELIIVDTGSTDRTVEIAKNYTQNVYHHPWNNNFSEMRNISIGYAKSEWIFILDADEEIKEDYGIIDFFKEKKHQSEFNTLAIRFRNFLKKDNLNSFSDLLSIRFFRNDGMFHFEGFVHNTPIFKGPVGSLDGIVYHFGYPNDDPVIMEKKFLRTSSLLYEALEKDPENIYYRYQLSTSLAMHQEWEDAEIEIMKVYDRVSDQSMQIKNLYFYIYGHLMMIYKHFEQYDQIIKIANEALEIRKNDIDSYFFISDALVSQNKKKESISYIEKYLELINEYESGNVSLEIDSKVETISHKYKYLFNLMYIYIEENQYREVLNCYAKNCEDASNSEFSDKILTVVIKAAIELNALEYVLELHRSESSEFVLLVEKEIENQMPYLNQDKRKTVYHILSKCKGNYGKLNGLREKIASPKVDLLSIQKHLRPLTGEMEIYYADLFFDYYNKADQFEDFIKWVLGRGLEESLELVDRLNHLNEGFEMKILKWLGENIQNSQIVDIGTLAFRNTIAKYFLMSYAYVNQQVQMLPLFKLYLIERKLFLKQIYLDVVIENESNWVSIENNSNRTVIYMIKATQVQPYEALKYMKKALCIEDELKVYVIEMIREVQREIEKSENPIGGDNRYD